MKKFGGVDSKSHDVKSQESSDDGGRKMRENQC